MYERLFAYLSMVGTEGKNSDFSEIPFQINEQLPQPFMLMMQLFLGDQMDQKVIGRKPG